MHTYIVETMNNGQLKRRTVNAYFLSDARSEVESMLIPGEVIISAWQK